MPELVKFEPFGDCWLHGSRAMSERFWPSFDLPEGTDYDYAVQHTQPWQEIVDKADALGWVDAVSKSYMDNDTAFVFEKMVEGKKIQVSLRQNLQRYKSCFSAIDAPFYFKYLWKGSDDCFDIITRRRYYNTLYDCWNGHPKPYSGSIW